ncbi:hypothetical protein ACVITL_006904 [Rhizobium pisi]
MHYPLMRYVFCRVLAMSEDYELLTPIASDRKPGIWGHRVPLEDAEPFSKLDMLGPGNSGSAQEIWKSVTRGGL